MAEFLRHQGREDLAKELGTVPPPATREKDSRDYDQRGQGFGKPDTPRGSGTSRGSDFDFMARARIIHSELLRIDERGKRISEKEEEIEASKKPEEALREERQRVKTARDEYETYITAWARGAREDIPEVRRRLESSLARLDHADPQRPAMRLITEGLKARIRAFDDFLANPPSNDKEFLNGLRHHLGRMVEATPSQGNSRRAESKRTERIEREIRLLQRRLTILESELKSLKTEEKGASSQDNESQTREALLPPLPPDW